MNWWTAVKVAIGGVKWVAQFQAWRKSRKADKAVKATICLIAMFMSMGAGCYSDIKDYCDEFPERCGGSPRPTPSPTSSPTAEPTSTPTAPPSPTATPTPSPAATATPTPPPTATPGAACPPTLFKFKVQNVDNHPNTREKYGCHNPQAGDKFQKNNICEAGSTPLFEKNACTPPGPSGPCDPPHAATFTTVCQNVEWLVPPRVSVDGAASWHSDSDNPFQTIVTFIPGQCFTICTWANDGDKTMDTGVAVPATPGNKTCAKHCY